MSSKCSPVLPPLSSVCPQRSEIGSRDIGHCHLALAVDATGRDLAHVGTFMLPFNMTRDMLMSSFNMSRQNASDVGVPRDTLDLMVLKTLAVMGPLHGFAVARRIEQVAKGALALNQGTIYPALLRLEQKGWIKSAWGTSDNNRRARFYEITKAGRKQLAAEVDLWERTVAMMNRMLRDRA